MTGMLASVNSLEEAYLALSADVDIIDLKQPEQGALGALSSTEVQYIVQQLQAAKPLSATIGDLPMQAEQVYEAALAMAKTGVDYIKIGFFPDGDALACVNKLSLLATQGYQLIAVLFADANPQLTLIPHLAASGFSGIMLDTMYKQNGSLSHAMSLAALEDFVHSAHQHNLLCGLAGSLKINDIAALHALRPDYLGFRGALCEQSQRTARLDKAAITQVKSAFPIQAALT